MNDWLVAWTALCLLVFSSVALVVGGILFRNGIPVYFGIVLGIAAKLLLIAILCVIAHSIAHS